MMVKPCSTKGSYNAIPDKLMKVDMEKLKTVKGLEMVTYTPYLDVVKLDGVEVVVYPSGKLIVRCTEKDIAERIAEKVFKLL